jgi:hypothetical protein
MLAGTSDEGLCLAGRCLFAWVWCVARLGAGVVADCPFAATRLRAWRFSIFTVSLAMAVLLAKVNATFQFLPTRESASDFGEPTGLILQGLFAADALLFDQKRTLWTRLAVFVALVLDLRMVTCSLPSTVESAFRRSSTTGLWWLENGFAACAADFGEDSFEAAMTRTFVAQLGAKMVPAFQWATTGLQTDMLCLKVFLCCSMSSIESPVFTLRSLPFTRFLLAWTASLSTLMSTTVESRSTNPSTLGWFFDSLMANTVRCRPSTAASDLNCLQTWPALAIVAQLLAQVTAVE